MHGKCDLERSWQGKIYIYIATHTRMQINIQADFLIMAHKYVGENNIQGAGRSPESSIGC